MRRTHSRLKWLLISLPFMVLALAFAFKLIGLSVVTQGAIIRYENGASYAAGGNSGLAHEEFEQSAETSGALLAGDWLGGNFIEKWIPWFNRADAKAADLDYNSAIDDFEKALEFAPADAECRVRVNLALSWEKLGDNYVQFGSPDGAVKLYEAGEAVIAAAEGRCDPPDEASDDLDQTGDRIEGKKQAAQEQADQLEAQDPSAGDEEEKLQELGEGEQAGEADKSNDDALDRGEDNQSTYTDKPW